MIIFKLKSRHLSKNDLAHEPWVQVSFKYEKNQRQKCIIETI